LQRSPAATRRAYHFVVLVAFFVTACGGAPATTPALPAADSTTTGRTSAVAGAATATTADTTMAVASSTATVAPAIATVAAATATPLQPTAVPTATVPPPTATAAPALATSAPPTVVPAAATGAATDSAAVARGKAIFLSSVGCALCHTINGLSSGDQGPNLTHIASQPYDSLPNDPAFLRRWITNPQAIKPGTIMPDLGLSPAQVNDLVAFLETMK
jgi:cytochrome c2